jgi:enoyl-CoA hydratase/carnithine racemase
MEAIDKPIIAAVNGAAIGWGMELVMLCDIKIASDKAILGDMHVVRGSSLDNGGLWMLPKLARISCSTVLSWPAAARCSLTR